MLFIDARNYYTVVDRTLNEWSEWQLKNLNAIVWLHRGEIDTYKSLLSEYNRYIRTMGEYIIGKEARRIAANLQNYDDLLDLRDALKSEIELEKEDCKEKIAKADKRNKKSIQQESDSYIAMIQRDTIVVNEAIWLMEKFGTGKYKDVLGLCKVASIDEIEEKGWSLTPGAYVGVAPVEDDGVDFAERMKEIHKELLALQAESNSLMDTISKNMEELGV